MLAADAMRLAAIEALCPTTALKGETPFPTLAGRHVFDSRATALDDLETDQTFTPTLAVYSEAVEVDSFGPGSPSTHGVASADLVVVTEIAVQATDSEGAYVDAATTDPAGKLTLGALCAQVRKRLVYDPAGFDLRSRLVATVNRLSIEPFSIPEFGLRYLRNTMRLSCHIADDEFTDDGGLPAPIRRLLSALPTESYARAKLEELEAQFTAISRQGLEGVNFADAEENPTIGAIVDTE